MYKCRKGFASIVLPIVFAGLMVPIGILQARYTKTQSPITNVVINGKDIKIDSSCGKNKGNSVEVTNDGWVITTSPSREVIRRIKLEDDSKDSSM